MLYIDGIVFSLQNSGGITVYFCEIIKRMNFSCLVKLFNNNNNMLLIEKSSFPGNVKFLSSRLNSLLLKIIRYLDVVVPNDTEIFHSSYYRLPVFWQRKNVKIITTVHDFTYERMRTDIFSYVHRYQKRRAILLSDSIVCISESTKKDLLYFIPEASKMDIRVIYNGVSNDFYQLDENSDSASSDYILFVGARPGYKNFSDLVEAIQNLPNMRLVVVGGGVFNEKEIKFLDSRIFGRYKHLKYVENSELNQLYNNAFCLVYPSLYEGFGIPVIEAMKAGCPVIASSSSCIPEVASNAAILIDDINPLTITDAINSLKDIELRKNLISLGLTNAKRFNWDYTYKQLSQLYLEKK